jgi:hypothetical protein
MNENNGEYIASVYVNRKTSKSASQWVNAKIRITYDSYDIGITESRGDLQQQIALLYVFNDEADVNNLIEAEQAIDLNNCEFILDQDNGEKLTLVSTSSITLSVGTTEEMEQLLDVLRSIAPNSIPQINAVSKPPPPVRLFAIPTTGNVSLMSPPSATKNVGSAKPRPPTLPPASVENSSVRRGFAPRTNPPTVSFQRGVAPASRVARYGRNPAAPQVPEFPEVSEPVAAKTTPAVETESVSRVGRASRSLKVYQATAPIPVRKPDFSTLATNLPARKMPPARIVASKSANGPRVKPVNDIKPAAFGGVSELNQSGARSPPIRSPPMSPNLTGKNPNAAESKATPLRSNLIKKDWVAGFDDEDVSYETQEPKKNSREEPTDSGYRTKRSLSTGAVAPPTVDDYPEEKENGDEEKENEAFLSTSESLAPFLNLDKKPVLPAQAPSKQPKTTSRPPTKNPIGKCNCSDYDQFNCSYCHRRTCSNCYRCKQLPSSTRTLGADVKSNGLRCIDCQDIPENREKFLIFKSTEVLRFADKVQVGLDRISHDPEAFSDRQHFMLNLPDLNSSIKLLKPGEFEKIQFLYGESLQLLLQSICYSGRLQGGLSKGSKSGYFYMTNDRKFILKSLNKSEWTLLKDKLLSPMVQYLQKHPDSLIPKILLCFKFTSLSSTLRFAVMYKIVNSELPVNRILNITGESTEKNLNSRELEEQKQSWNDVKEMPESFLTLLSIQLLSDVEFLRENGLIGYNMLVGIHNYSQVPAEYIVNVGSARTKNFSPPTPSEEFAQITQNLKEYWEERLLEHRGISDFRRRDYNAGPEFAHVEDVFTNVMRSMKALLNDRGSIVGGGKSSIHDEFKSPFQLEMNGVMARTSEAAPKPFHFFFGIVDILQPAQVRTGIRVLGSDSSKKTNSEVNSYAIRFLSKYCGTLYS